MSIRINQQDNERINVWRYAIFQGVEIINNEEM